MSDKTITITVLGGCVTDVDNLPDGWDYEVDDQDVNELDLCDCCMSSGVKISQTCSGCGKTMCSDCAKDNPDGICPSCQDEA